CLTASVCCRNALRTCLFLLPYIVVSGFLSFLQENNFSPGSSPTWGLGAFFHKELLELQAAASGFAPGRFGMTTRLVSLICLAGLTGLFWRVRDRNDGDTFDAAGRSISGGLVLSGIAAGLNLPLLSSASLIFAALAGLWSTQLRNQSWLPAPHAGEPMPN